MPAAQIHLTPGLTLLDAYRAAQSAGMYLINNGFDVKVSPIIPPGWREIPLRIKTTAPRIGQPGGHVCTTEQEAA
jgi:hypothetical protein